MTDTLHLDEFQAYLLAEDRSPATIAGYLGDVRLFAQWYEVHYREGLTPDGLTNEAVRGYNGSTYSARLPNLSRSTAGWLPWHLMLIGWSRLDM